MFQYNSPRNQLREQWLRDDLLDMDSDQQIQALQTGIQTWYRVRGAMDAVLSAEDDLTQYAGQMKEEVRFVREMEATLADARDGDTSGLSMAMHRLAFVSSELYAAHADFQMRH